MAKLVLSTKTKILVGSSVFFSGFPDYVQHDTDYVIFENLPDTKYFLQVQRVDGIDMFFWNKTKTKQELIDYHLKYNMGLEIGKFLVPAVLYHLGMTIEDLKQLEPLLANLKDKHKYEEVIFRSYITNGDFYLTEQQLNSAYNIYKKYRNE